MRRPTASPRTTGRALLTGGGILVALALVAVPVVGDTAMATTAGSEEAAVPGDAMPEAPPASSELYAPWARVLSTYVDDEGLVDYAGLKERGRDDLEAFMTAIAEVDPADFASDDERKAFWINAYNAVVMWQVVERYPLDSVRDVGALWGLVGGFFKKEYRVAGRDMSADDIEHGTLRARWPEDAEIHWVLVCAAFGCPRLIREPYVAEDLDETLDARGREFLSRPRGLQLDRDTDTLYVSSYFDWYEEDFERVAGSVVDYVLELGPADVAAYVRERRDDLRIEIMDYDWTLNDQAKGPRSAREVPR